MKLRVAALLALSLAPALPSTALAQAYQCAPPPRIQLPAPPQQDGPIRRLPVAGYTLAASWSPEFCRAGGRNDPIQCSGANGRFGFVLHGLWPQARRGASPQWCSLTPRPSPELIRRHVCMTPAPRLLEHEWAKHGSCMSKTPEAYFNASAVLWQSLRWPDADSLSRQNGLTVGDLRSAFVIANPDWRRDMIGIVLSRSGWLREVRLCYGRDFMPTACPRDRLGPPDSASLKIWRGL